MPLQGRSIHRPFREHRMAHTSGAHKSRLLALGFGFSTPPLNLCRSPFTSIHRVRYQPLPHTTRALFTSFSLAITPRRTTIQHSSFDTPPKTVTRHVDSCCTAGNSPKHSEHRRTETRPGERRSRRHTSPITPTQHPFRLPRLLRAKSLAQLKHLKQPVPLPTQHASWSQRRCTPTSCIRCTRSERIM